MFSRERKRGNLVASETLTLAGDASDVDSAVLDFLKTDRPFTIYVVNEEGSPLTATLDVDLLASDDENGTYGVLLADVVADFDDGAAAAVVDPKTGGIAPYYKIRLDPDGSMSSENVTVAVFQNDNAAVR